MSEDSVSVSEAAGILGVHPQRIHQRIREGSLPAEKIGSQWVVERGDLRRIQHHVRPGRPLSMRSAWHMLLVAAGDPGAAAASPSARSRARSRLRALVGAAGSTDLDAGAARVSHALANRAGRELFVASPLDLGEVRDNPRVVLSGVSLAESNVSAGDLVEGYVGAADLEDVVEHLLLSSATRSRANVILHVVPTDLVDLDLALAVLVRSPLALSADLVEHDGVREKSEGLRALSRLQEAHRG